MVIYSKPSTVYSLEWIIKCKLIELMVSPLQYLTVSRMNDLLSIFSTSYILVWYMNEIQKFQDSHCSK
jgi:hypothetical protein